MADISTTEAAGGVAAPAVGTTGGAQGTPPSLSKLYDQLPEAARKEIKAERFSTLPKLDNLVAEIVRLDGEVGNGIRIPSKDAPKEAWDKYRKDLGIPSSPEGYALTKPKLPDGLPYSDRLEKWFRQELFDAGVSNEHAQKMFDDWNKTQSESYAAAVQAREAQTAKLAAECIEQLKTEYKDTYPQMMQLRDTAISAFGGPDLVAIFKQARMPNGLTLDNDVRVNKMMVEIGKRMAADTLVPGETAPGTPSPRPGLPKTSQGYALEFPSMNADPRFRVKAQ